MENLKKENPGHRNTQYLLHKATSETCIGISYVPVCVQVQYMNHP